MKITTNNRGTYYKVAGKELDGVMSLAMWNWIVGNDKNAKEYGVLTDLHFFNFSKQSEWRKLELDWGAQQLADRKQISIESALKMLTIQNEHQEEEFMTEEEMNEFIQEQREELEKEMM